MSTRSRQRRYAVIGNCVMDTYLLGLGAWPNQPGTRTTLESIVYRPAGNGLSTARCLSKLHQHQELLGAQIDLLTGLADGGHAKSILDACQYVWPSIDAVNDQTKLVNRVNTRLAGTEDQRKATHTAVSFVQLNDNGEGTFLHCKNSSKLITAEFIRAHLEPLKSADMIFLCGVDLLPNLNFVDMRTIIDEVRAFNSECTVILDVCHQPLEAIARSGLREQLVQLLAVVDFFIPNAAEAKLYSGVDNLEAAARTFNNAIGARTATGDRRRGTIIKRGKDAVKYYEIGKPNAQDIDTYNSNTIKNIKVVDTTGAGDCWGAGFGYKLAHGDSVEEACKFANAVACLCIQGIGSTSMIKDAVWIEQWMVANEAQWGGSLDLE